VGKGYAVSDKLKLNVITSSNDNATNVSNYTLEYSVSSL